jgi:hypothetical protein
VNRKPQDLDSICAILMRLSVEANTLAEQYAREGYRRDRSDQESSALSGAAVLLMEHEVRLAQACDALVRMSIIAGLHDDDETQRILGYLSEGGRVDPHLRRLKPKRLPLHYRAHQQVWAFLLGASDILRAYG